MLFYDLYWHSYIVTSCICLLTILIIYRRINVDFGSETENFTFKSALFFGSIFIITNFLNVIVNTCVNNLLFNWIINILNTSSIIICLFFWILFIELKFNINSLFIKKYKLFAVILIITILLIVSTPITKFLYYLEDDVLVRNHGYVVLMLLISLFFFITQISAIIEIRNGSLAFNNYIKRISFYISPLIAGLFDYFWGSIPVLELVITFAAYHMFILIQTDKIYIDALTGVNNRRKTDEYLNTILTYKSNITLLLCDLDDFKNINDTYGHLEGDRALKVVAHSLLKFADNYKCFVSRWGGDEFLIIFNYELSDINFIIKSINEIAKEEIKNNGLDFDISISFGYAHCDKKITKEELFKKADENLYCVKKSKNKISKINS